MKTKKHHPDRDILCALVRRKRACTNEWTREETEMLMKAVTKYGKNYEKISTLLKNRTKTQVGVKVNCMLRQIACNPKHENSKYAKILNKLPCVVPHVWTDQQKKKFNAALLTYGCSWNDIMKLFPTLTYTQMYNHSFNLRKAIERDKNHSDAHLKKILEAGRIVWCWT